MSKPKILYRYDEGWQYSEDRGQTWYRTQRTDAEVRLMCENNVAEVIGQPPSEDLDDIEELYGGTLDEPIPEDLLDMLRNL